MNLDYVAIISIGMDSPHYLKVSTSGKELLEYLERIGALDEDVGLEFCSIKTFEWLNKYWESVKIDIES